jgi:hypothetical protein
MVAQSFYILAKNVETSLNNYLVHGERIAALSKACPELPEGNLPLFFAAITVTAGRPGFQPRQTTTRPFLEINPRGEAPPKPRP